MTTVDNSHPKLIIAGNPTAEELAALLAALATRRGTPEAAPEHSTFTPWRASALPGPRGAAPGAWRLSALPR